MADRVVAREPSAAANRASVVVVEGHDITRAGLRSLLAQLPAVDVVGEAGDARSGIRLCAAQKPDLVVVDPSLTDGPQDDIIAQIRQDSPRSAIIALSSQRDPESVISAIQAGATAFLLKDSPSAALAAAVERVLAGDAFVDRTLAGPLIHAFALAPLQANQSFAPEPLTPREVEVLRSIARGRSNKEIAFDLHMAAGTVKVHVERILRKLSVANRAEATMRAVRLGILDPEERERLQDPPILSKPR